MVSTTANRTTKTTKTDRQTKKQHYHEQQTNKQTNWIEKSNLVIVPRLSFRLIASAGISPRKKEKEEEEEEEEEYGEHFFPKIYSRVNIL